jgi:hypothetical protein
LKVAIAEEKSKIFTFGKLYIFAIYELLTNQLILFSQTWKRLGENESQNFDLDRVKQIMISGLKKQKIIWLPNIFNKKLPYNILIELHETPGKMRNRWV